MDGSSLSLILIPVVVVISLAAWLIMVAYAARHPSWKHGPAAPQDVLTTRSHDAQVPLPRTENPLPRAQDPRPVRQPTHTRPLVTAGHAGH